MANSFQDQLLKAGLVDKKKVNKVKQEKYKKTKQKQGRNAATDDEEKLRAQQTMREQAELDRELNRRKVESQRLKAIQAQIRQLIEMNRIAQDDNGVAYNFQHDNAIKRVYVSEDTHKRIVSGHLAIACFDERYEIIPRRVAEKIQQRDDGCIVVFNSTQDSGTDDDEYADYKVPDDLMW